MLYCCAGRWNQCWLHAAHQRGKYPWSCPLRRNLTIPSGAFSVVEVSRVLRRICHRQEARGAAAPLADRAGQVADNHSPASLVASATEVGLSFALGTAVEDLDFDHLLFPFRLSALTQKSPPQFTGRVGTGVDGCRAFFPGGLAARGPAAGCPPPGWGFNSLHPPCSL